MKKSFLILPLLLLPLFTFATQYDPGWPDVIYCKIDAAAVGPPTSTYPEFPLFYQVNDVHGDFLGNGAGDHFYRNNYLGDGLNFNSDKSPNLPLAAPSECNGLSISQLYTNGNAFDYGGGSSSAGLLMTSSTDAIVGNVFNQIYLLGWFFFFVIVFWISFKITKR